MLLVRQVGRSARGCKPSTALYTRLATLQGSEVKIGFYQGVLQTPAFLIKSGGVALGREANIAFVMAMD